MNNTTKKILLFFISSWPVVLFSQKIIVFNPIPDFYLQHPGIVNASTYTDSLYINFNYKSRLGAYQDVRDLYFDICLPLQENQRAGIKVYSEQETSLFTKNKLELFYLYTVTIKQKLKWTLAGQGGFAQINFQSTGANSGGNAIGPDLSLSSKLELGSYTLTYAYYQLTRTKLQPISYTFILHPYNQVALIRSIQLTPDINLRLGGNSYFNNYFFQWEAMAEAAYENFGLLGKWGESSNYAVGAYVSVPIVESYTSKIGVSYSNAYYPGVIGSNSLSVFLQLIQL